MVFFWRKTRRYSRKLSPAETRKRRAAERAAAGKYLTGEKIRRWESPRMIAQHGREPWDRKTAYEHELKQLIRGRLVANMFAHGDAERMRARKADRKKVAGWSLRTAKVGRSKRTGRFTAR